MMMISSIQGQALIDAYDAMQGDLEENPVEAEQFMQAAREVVDNLHEQGFRPGREGD